MQVLFQDPIDDESSDAESFNEDDMYGSDPDVETISLISRSTSNVLELNDEAVADLVCSFFSWLSCTI